MLVLPRRTKEAAEELSKKTEAAQKVAEQMKQMKEQAAQVRAAWLAGVVSSSVRRCCSVGCRWLSYASMLWALNLLQ